MRLLPVGVCLLAVVTLMPPNLAGGQEWEIQIARVTIDHDDPPWVAEDGEQIPRGFGVSARRSLGAAGFFLEFEHTLGVEERPGTILVDWAVPENNIPETIEYSGGVSVLSLGWAGRAMISDSWSVGLLPEIGIGLLRAKEQGTSTGRSYRERQTATSIGLGVELSFLVPAEAPVWITAAATWNRLRPFLVDDCLDCRQIFRESLPAVSFGMGVRWGAGAGAR